jgi:hypothetical protein
MSAQLTPLAIYRNTVAGLISEGQPFGDIEDAIDDLADLTMDQKAALWLFGFSLRDRSDQQRDAQAALASVQ